MRAAYLTVSLLALAAAACSQQEPAADAGVQDQAAAEPAAEGLYAYGRAEA